MFTSSRWNSAATGVKFHCYVGDTQFWIFLQYLCLWLEKKCCQLFLNVMIFISGMDLFPDTQNCRLRMRRECWERFPRHWLQMKPPVSDPGMHHGTCFTHVPWCMSWPQTRGGGENVPGIPGACAPRNLTYLARGPLRQTYDYQSTDDASLKKYNWINHMKALQWLLS